ncbi:MAG: hypothetical protein CM15mP74_35750 [Halieaceae bacterium]|nr:MAG: hypothetical protein CM15mP74_35750 [Halieaceae bacterium]
MWGVFGAVGSLGGSLLGLLAGFMIQRPAMKRLLLIASLHLISAVLLQIFVPKIAWSLSNGVAESAPRRCSQNIQLRCPAQRRR